VMGRSFRWEVTTGKLSEPCDRRRIICPSGEFRRGEPAEILRLAADHDRSRPPRAIWGDSDPSKSSGVVAVGAGIRAVLRGGGGPEIGFAVVKFDPTDVVNKDSRLNPQHEPMQKDFLGADTLRFVPCPDGVALSAQVPLVPQHSGGVLGVNDRKSALCEGNENGDRLVVHSDLLSLCHSPGLTQSGAGASHVHFTRKDA
jgi:hypothetical protein